MKTIIFTLAMAFLLSGCKSGTVAASNNSREKAPEFDLVNIAGGSIKSSNIKGKVVIVDFWATDCQPCIQEIPDYNSLYSKYKDKGVEFVGIAVASGTEADIKPMVKDFQIKYPVVVGTEKVEKGFGGILGTPMTFVLGKDWTIHHRYFGDPPNKKASMEKEINDLLN